MADTRLVSRPCGVLRDHVTQQTDSDWIVRPRSPVVLIRSGRLVLSWRELKTMVGMRTNPAINKKDRKFKMTRKRRNTK